MSTKTHHGAPGCAREHKNCQGAPRGRQWNTMENKGAQGSTSEHQGAHRKHWESARECQGSARERQGAPEPLGSAKRIREHQIAPWSTREHQGSPGGTREHQEVPGCARVRQGAPRSTRSAREHRGAPGSARETPGSTQKGPAAPRNTHASVAAAAPRRDGRDGRTHEPSRKRLDLICFWELLLALGPMLVLACFEQQGSPWT